jgi:uncharacterized protein
MKECLIIKKMIVVLILGLALAGCVTRPSPPTYFYMIAPLVSGTEQSVLEMEKEHTVIAISNVLIPSYLDRNQIVTRLNEVEYELGEFDQWAEPINDNLTRAVAQNLSRILAADTVDVFPAAKEVPHNYIIGIEVIRLDGKLDDHITLSARWAIFGRDQDDLIVLRKFEHQEKIVDQPAKLKPAPAASDTAQSMPRENYRGLVLAQSRAVEKLSRDIAAAVKEILKKP